MNNVNIIIAGSRTYSDYAILKLRCDNILNIYDKNKIKIISGGAKGVDTLAKQYAIDNNFEYNEFVPYWNIYGKMAGPMRNEVMAKFATKNKNDISILIAFWLNNSAGTKSMIQKAKLYKFNKIYIFDGDLL